MLDVLNTVKCSFDSATQLSQPGKVNFEHRSLVLVMIKIIMINKMVNYILIQFLLLRTQSEFTDDTLKLKPANLR